MSQKLHTLLKTALVLSEQFQTTLDTTPPASQNATTTTTDGAQTADPLEILANSSKSLRAQVTKLSLLAITAPFTPSAISTCLTSVNDSVMPSMVTAALLLTPVEYTKAFSTEARILVKTGLKEFAVLIQEITNIAHELDPSFPPKSGEQSETKKKELSKEEKDALTSQTGRVWDVCDTIMTLVSQGVVGHVAKRVQQWHDLVKDAISELEEWDPEDEDDGGFEELMGSDDDDDSETENADEDGDDSKDVEALETQKKSLLRALKPIAQIYPAIVTNRVKKGGLAVNNSQQIAKLESLTANLQSIPDHVDEAAGSLYEHNLDDCVKYLKLAKSTAEKAIDVVVFPWGEQQQEDKFTVWSRTWRKVMGDVISDRQP
ncbi:hypothetical protein TMatcc_007684 [Talaromyces marneffei ATCC 18224]|uniref:Cyclin-D1-binding protein 1-like N-terminal domain-containing protein n=2 Tax=Talaromyces marneffei TaxID=37727 RepID=B6QGJ3_TALMQ|nr:conserved hypothetical protein [Talaromyces marneffei ATCC 18224]KAE8552919.1 hypothetical protein EYB25_004298 [Talaromyces marneffei]